VAEGQEATTKAEEDGEEVVVVAIVRIEAVDYCFVDNVYSVYNAYHNRRIN
jgi:hypothetical protein